MALYQFLIPLGWIAFTILMLRILKQALENHDQRVLKRELDNWNLQERLGISHIAAALIAPELNEPSRAAELQRLHSGLDRARTDLRATHPDHTASRILSSSAVSEYENRIADRDFSSYETRRKMLDLAWVIYNEVRIEQNRRNRQ